MFGVFVLEKNYSVEPLSTQPVPHILLLQSYLFDLGHQPQSAENPLREKETRSRPRKYLSMKIEVQVGTGMIHKDRNLFLVL